MDITFEPEIKDKLVLIKKKQPKLFQKIQKQLRFFSENSKHPSLRTHKLKGTLSNSWSLSVEHDFRILYRQSEKGIRVFRLGSHNEVYKFEI